MNNRQWPPDEATMRSLMRLMLKNFGNAERRSAGSMIGAPTMRKGYLQRNSERTGGS